MLSQIETKKHIKVLEKEVGYVSKSHLLSDFEQEHIRRYILSRVQRLKIDLENEADWKEKTSRSEYDRISDGGMVKYVMRGH